MSDDRFTVQKKQSSNKTIRMPDDMIKKLQALADSHDTSFNQVVVQCCEFALEHMKDDTP